MKSILLVHGGAGDIGDDMVSGKLNGVKESLRMGFSIFKNGGSSLDAVETAVKCMEEDENFNAGYGSVLNTQGYVELEASIMEGTNLKAGCVTLLQDIMHPITVARRVMEHTNHTFIGGESAMEFARSHNIEFQAKGSLVTPKATLALKEFKKRQNAGLDTNFSRTELGDYSTTKESGTVGAVAIDENGNIAVATSTGGITGKIPGRIGDTPLIGSGTYADNLVGGVSTTGHGETIMRFNLAQRILEKIRYEKVNAQIATEWASKQMTQRLKGTGGAITIDCNRQIGIYFTSKRMAWGFTKGDELHYGINPDDRFIESF